MTQNRLGRGLEAILGDSRSMLGAGQDDVRQIPIERLKPGSYQPRREYDERALDELAGSIRAHGIIQPIIARSGEQASSYEIVAGERRWRAAQRAELHEVPVIVREIDDNSALAMSLIENIQREDLNPVEEAMALKRLSQEFSMTHDDIAQSVGKSRATITNLLRLLGLRPKVLEHLSHGRIEIGHGKVLLALDGDMQVLAAAEVVAGALSVRQTEALVKRYLAGKRTNKTKHKDADIRSLERELADKVGAMVAISDNGGKGFLKIRYDSLDQLEGIINQIN